MPLMKSKSKKAFGENVAKEMDSGKPQKQALAIAYSVKRKSAAKKAKGGMMKDSSHEMPEHMLANAYAEGGEVMESEHEEAMSALKRELEDKARAARPMPEDMDKMAMHTGKMPGDLDEEDMGHSYGSVVDALKRKHHSKIAVMAKGGEVSDSDEEKSLDAFMHELENKHRDERPMPEDMDDYAVHTGQMSGDIDEDHEEHSMEGIAEALKRKHSKIAVMADGGEVEDEGLESDSVEMPADMWTHDNHGMKENYSEHVALKDMASPSDSGMHGDDDEREYQDSVAARVRRKAMRRG